MRKEVLFICNKCKKVMPIDREKSNDNWMVYKKECPCGGKGKIKLPHETYINKFKNMGGNGRYFKNN